MIDLQAPVEHMLDSSHGKPRLLLVDDHAQDGQPLFHCFADTYQVQTASDGAQALALCLESPPDLVVLDIVMPGMDGFTVCQRLKANEATRHIPVIFVTAHAEAALETQGLAAGAVDFIAKPINPDVVRARVKTHLTLKFQSDLLRQLVFLDGLTAVFNRRFFDQQLGMEWARAMRSNAPLSLILLDIDFFKRYNDHYGHQAGDDALRQVAHTLKDSLRRPADLVARFGGEEFACILPETAFEDALGLAHDLERKVRELSIAHQTSSVDGVVTLSIGLATRVSGTVGEATDLVALADKLLYQAKHTGRGRVCSGLLEPPV